MKKIRTPFALIPLFVTIWSGCSVLEKYSVSSSSIDLSKFKEQGVFVTTGDLSKSYESISILTVECYNGYELKENTKQKSKSVRTSLRSDDIYVSNQSEFDRRNNFHFKPCRIDDLFEEMIRKANECGANGIIKLEIKNIYRQGLNSKTTQSGTEIMGLAVKIED